MWHMTVLDRVNGGHAIVFRVHHCITDGLGLVHVLNHLTDDNGLHGKTPSPVGHPHRAVAHNKVCSAVVRGLSWLKIGFHVARLSILWPDAHTQFKAPMTGAKQLVWLPPLEMEPRARHVQAHGRHAQRRLGRRRLRRPAPVPGERGQSPDGRALRAAVTFNLREKANAFQLGNEFGLVAVDLPTNVDEAPSACACPAAA
jgi:hypothetical protein